jgi:hypothetical protein
VRALSYPGWLFQQHLGVRDDRAFVPGPEVGRLIKDVLATPKDVIDAAKVMMKLQ